MQNFNAYINMLVNAMPGTVETENLEGSEQRIVRLAETEAQQTALLANALLLADELVPRAAMKLSPSLQDPAKRASDRRLPEQRELKKRLQRVVDQLRDTFCRQHALELIFAEDGGVRLNADMYLSMDGSGEEPEWFPSLIYQVVLAGYRNVFINIRSGSLIQHEYVSFRSYSKSCQGLPSLHQICLWEEKDLQLCFW